MSANALSDFGLYLYAIIQKDTFPKNGIVGIDGGNVYTISYGNISAVVSGVLNIKMRPERRHLAAHQSVLKEVMAKSTPLPMSFGTIADGPDKIKTILSNNQFIFEEQLKRVYGKIEMKLRVSWDVPNIFEFFINNYPELRAERNKYFDNHRNPTQEEQITLGKFFEEVTNEEREKHTQTVERILSIYCDEILRDGCKDEKEIMNLYCLVSRANEDRFEGGVLAAANLFDNNFAFDYSGPWAPHNFVDLNIVY